ncbi:MAG: MBL fold metallo-hydrolase [Oscillospiraceae bacterium]
MDDLYNNLNMINCDGVHCYVFKAPDGDILIDTGEVRYRDSIEMWLLNYDIKKILLTHGHSEAAGNAKYFSELFDAPIYMSKADHELILGNSDRNVFSVGLTGAALSFLEERKKRKPVEQFDVHKYIDENSDVSSELGTECRVYSAEGHTKGSLAYLFGSDLYIGDAVMNVLYPCFPAICESPKRARSFITRLKEIAPERILFAHGEPIRTHDNKLYLNLFSKNIIM